MSHNVFLALGTNLGDRLANLADARNRISPVVDLIACSPIYETPPWGYLDQSPFLNQVIEGHTELSPKNLLDYIKYLEVDLGRIPSVHNGPRLIDIDILFYDDIVIDLPMLTIPHPRMRGRAFVLLPLSDLAPDLNHPVLQRTVVELLGETDISGIKLYDLTNNLC